MTKGESVHLFSIEERETLDTHRIMAIVFIEAVNEKEQNRVSDADSIEGCREERQRRSDPPSPFAY